MILPIGLDLQRLPVLLVAAGPCGAKRLEMLRAAAPASLALFQPEGDLAEGERRLPSPAELAQARVVFLAGLDRAATDALAAQARDNGQLLNVEDQPDLCDFHVPALVRRGALTLSVSTAGRSPTLARRLRQELERAFPPVWGERLERLGALRDTMRAGGAGMRPVSEAANALIDREGWLEGSG